MQPQGSLSYQKQHTAPLYPETDQSSRRAPSYFLQANFHITLPSSPRVSKWTLSLRFTHQNLVSTSSTYVAHVPPIAFFLILLPE